MESKTVQNTLLHGDTGLKPRQNCWTWSQMAQEDYDGMQNTVWWLNIFIAKGMNQRPTS